MRVSVCQMSCNVNKAENTETALRLLGDAASQGAEVAVLPEYLDYIGPEEGMLSNSEELDGPLSSALAARARELGIWVVGGSIRIRDGGERVRNTTLVYDPEGVRVAIYSKLHVFDVCIAGEVDFLESRTVCPGVDVVNTEIAGVPSGLSICYDLRFPELFRLLALGGAKVLYLPAAFTAFTGRDHWELLLRARAVENQCFVVAAAQFGNALPAIPFYGRSMIVNPWGTVLACAPDGVGVVTADLDLSYLEGVRRKLPSLQNRRADIYNLTLIER